MKKSSVLVCLLTILMAVSCSTTSSYETQIPVSVNQVVQETPVEEDIAVLESSELVPVENTDTPVEAETITEQDTEPVEVLQMATEEEPVVIDLPLIDAIRDVADSNIIISLINSGLDINAQDSEGRTAIMYAAKTSSSSTIIRLLIAAGADVNQADDNGNTSLLYVCGAEASEDFTINTRIVKLLISAGADVNMQNDEGMTAIAYASSLGSAEAVDMLIAAGADATVAY